MCISLDYSFLIKIRQKSSASLLNEWLNSALIWWRGGGGEVGGRGLSEWCVGGLGGQYLIEILKTKASSFCSKDAHR